MSIHVLGISAFYHDAAAALVRDGEIVAAAQEERFTRRKHDPDFPRRAVEYCLAEGGVEPGELDVVVFYEKPFLKFDRLVETYLAYAPLGFLSFRQAIPEWLRRKLHLPRELDRGLRGEFRGRYAFTEHHEAHAASAFLPSPFEEAAILTVDGVGEWATATLGVGRGNSVEILREIRFPHSLGLLYSAFTYYTGFRVNSGEYKMMGLAPYGRPRFADVIRDELVDVKEDGSFRLNMEYFGFGAGLRMTNRRFHELFGAPPRTPDAPLTQHYMDVAASAQLVTEEVVLAMARHAHAATGLDALCMAGGVALNCVANGRVLRETPFGNVWIQPAAGDAGGALGAAMLVSNQLLELPRPRGAGTNRATTKAGGPEPDTGSADVVLRAASTGATAGTRGDTPSAPLPPGDGQRGSLLGPSFSDEEVVRYLDSVGAVHHRLDSFPDVCDATARRLMDGEVVGWFQGRMEFGPRALGSRSILADPRSTEMQRAVNLRIKFRESFRPFAPAVLREHVADWFAVRREEDWPYMLLVAEILDRRRTPCDEALARADGLAKLEVPRSEIPAVTHVDFTARVQTVDAQRHGAFHALLSRFHELTGCPVLVNTSFNVRGEPIVCTPEDAYRCFMATEMDTLVLGRHLLLKSRQPDADARRWDYTTHLPPD